MKTSSSSFNEILQIQREQFTRTETELRYIAANVDSILDELNKKVIAKNGEIDFDKCPLTQVFRGQNLDWEINSIVNKGLAKNS